MMTKQSAWKGTHQEWDINSVGCWKVQHRVVLTVQCAQYAHFAQYAQHKLRY
jgi:hypothetical protein